MSSTPDPLAKWRRPGQTPATVAPEAASGKVAYEPYRVASAEKRHLEIRLKFPEPAECPSNMSLTNVRVEWRCGTGATLVYGSSMVVIIEGENLTELSTALRDWKVEWIAEFDPQEHLPPTDSSKPFIKSITIHTGDSRSPAPETKH